MSSLCVNIDFSSRDCRGGKGMGKKSKLKRGHMLIDSGDK